MAVILVLISFSTPACQSLLGKETSPWPEQHLSGLCRLSRCGHHLGHDLRDSSVTGSHRKQSEETPKRGAHMGLNEDVAVCVVLCSFEDPAQIPAISGGEMSFFVQTRAVHCVL